MKIFVILAIYVIGSAYIANAQALLVRATAVRSTSMDVIWNAIIQSQFATSKYRIAASTNSFSNCGVGAFISVTRATIDTTADGIGFRPLTTYHVKVCGYWVNAAGAVLRAQESKSFTTGPPAPTNLEVFNIQATQLSVRWNVEDASIVSTYQVFYGSHQITSTSPPVTINNLQTNTRYNIHVRSVTSNAISDDSATTPGITLPAKAGSPTRQASTVSSITLRWNRVNEGSVLRSYLVTWTVSTGGSASNRTTTASSTTITNLQSNTDYNIIITAKNEVGFGQPSNQVMFATVPAKANTPTRVSATSSSITLQWNPINEGLVTRSYIVVWRISNNGLSASRTTFGTVITLANLQSNTAYEINITAGNNAGVDQPSDLVTYETVPAKANTPTRVLSTATSITLRWDEVNEGEVTRTYQVTWKASNNESILNSSVAGTSFTITALQSNTAYDVAITPRNRGGDGPQSSLVSFSTVPAKANTPYQVLSTSSTIELRWSHVNEGSVSRSYIATWKVSNNGKSFSREIAGNSTTLTNLQPNTAYDVAITASNVAGDGLISDEATVRTGPAAPINLEVFINHATQLSVRWNGVHLSVVTNYRVQYWMQSGPVQQKTSTSQEVALNSLKTNTRYNIRVRSLTNNAAVTSDDSALVTGITLPAKANAPTRVSSTSSSITLQWNPVNEGSVARSYIITWRISDNGQTNYTRTTAETSTTVTNLQSNTAYDVTIRSRNAAGDGEDSDQASFFTVPGSPILQDVFPSKANPCNEITVVWKQPIGGDVIERYTVEWRRPGSSYTQNSVDHESMKMDYSYTLVGLMPVTTYQIRVRARNSAGTGSFTNVATVRTDFESIPGFTFNEVADNRTEVFHVGHIVVSCNHCASVGKTYAFISQQDLHGRRSKSNITICPLHMEKNRRLYPISFSFDELQGADIYNIVFLPSKGVSSFNQTLTHYSVNNLTPGQEYSITITAFQRGEATGQILRQITTVPNQVNNLSVLRNFEDPSGRIDLNWTSPNGRGDHIWILYESTTSNRESSTTYPLSATKGTLYVEPGNNYTVTVVTQSGKISSSTQRRQISSRPATIKNFVATFTQVGLRLTWNPIQGFAEFIEVDYTASGSDTSRTASSGSTSYLIKDVKQSGNYEATIRSVIIDVEGNELGGEVSKISHEEPPAAGLIAGITVGAAALLGLVIVLFVVLYKKNYFRRKSVFDRKCSAASDIVVFRRSQPPVQSKPHNKHDLKQYMEESRRNNYLSITQEFDLLVDVGCDQSTEIASNSVNKKKNRTKHILSYDENRVKLSTDRRNNSSDYINASYISGTKHDMEYIATQAPMSNTKNDFWNMIWDENCRIIVMLAQVTEAGKKNYVYWPSTNQSISSGDMTVKGLTENWIFKDFAHRIREFDLTKNEETRRIRQFHFTKWEKHDVPEDIQDLIRFVSYVRDAVEAEVDIDGPTVVHCCAGVGRTGTFVALDQLLQNLRVQDYVDVFGVVYKMRMQRPQMVQTENQYIFIFKVLEECLTGSCLYEQINARHASSYANDCLPAHMEVPNEEYSCVNEAHTSYNNSSYINSAENCF